MFFRAAENGAAQTSEQQHRKRAMPARHRPFLRPGERRRFKKVCGVFSCPDIERSGKPCRPSCGRKPERLSRTRLCSSISRSVFFCRDYRNSMKVWDLGSAPAEITLRFPTGVFPCPVKRPLRCSRIFPLVPSGLKLLLLNKNIVNLVM